MTDYLVTELGGDLHAYSCLAQWGERSVRVTAKSPEHAAKIAMGLWERPGRYAVRECTFVDLTIPDGIDGGLIDSVAGQGPR